MAAFQAFVRMFPTSLVLVRDGEGKWAAHAAECVQRAPSTRVAWTDQGCLELIRWANEQSLAFEECGACTPRVSLRKAFAVFRQHCSWLTTLAKGYDTLFREERDRDLLNRAAGWFFSELSQFYYDHLLLLAARLLDDAGSPPRADGTRKRENLTIPKLVEWIKDLGQPVDSILRAADQAMEAREQLKDLRDKVLAHMDQSVALGEREIQPPDSECLDRFLCRLQRFSDEVGGAIGEGALALRVPGTEGDAKTLLSHLRVAVAIRAQEKERWYQLQSMSSSE